MKENEKQYYYVILKNLLLGKNSQQIITYAEEVNGELREIITGEKIYMITDSINYPYIIDDLLEKDCSFIGIFKNKITDGLLATHLTFMTENVKREKIENLYQMKSDVEQCIKDSTVKTRKRK